MDIDSKNEAKENALPTYVAPELTVLSADETATGINPSYNPETLTYTNTIS